MEVDFDGAAPPTPDRVIFAWPGRYATRLGTVDGDWLIDSKLDGVFRVDPAFRTLRIYGETTPPSAACCDVLVRRILPRIMAARGAVTIHAAAVAYCGSAVLLLGASGAGKSTTTAALSTMVGWEVLSDDLSVMREGVPPQVAPSATGVCLWDASRRALDLDPALCHPMPGYDGKYRFEPMTSATTAAMPLKAFVFLSREADIAAPILTSIDRGTALIEAARQLILFNPAAPPMEERAAAITQLSRIAKAVPMLRLSYPSRYDALPAVADALAGLARA